MIRAAIICLPLCLTSLDVQAQGLTAPSGLEVEGVDYLFDAEAGFARFRLVAPTLGGEGAGIADVSDDFRWFCETFAVAALNTNGVTPDQIVISIADRTVPFGVSDPEATQYFTGFSTDGITCTEELF